MIFESSSFDKNFNNEISTSTIGTEILLNDKSATCTAYKIYLHGKWLVLKRIKPEYIGNPVIEKSFEKEFEIGFSLDHPHVVKYINKGNDKDGTYIITEYIDGKTLREHFNNGIVFSKKQIKQIIIQLFEAISYLHKKNIFHLDLKPENILISDKTGNIKLIDFGFSYSDGQLPVSSGTKKYNFPKQDFQTENISNKNDLYSIGIIIIELFTNEPDLRKINNLPGGYKKITKKCLNINPEKSFSADEALLLLNKQTTSPLFYIIIGAVILSGAFFLFKNNVTEIVPIQIKNESIKTNWSALPTMPKGRADGKAFYYKNKIYYVSGAGADGGLTTNDVFEFDINTKTYITKKSIGTARAEIGAAELDGKIYTFGGWLGNGPTDTSEMFDIQLNKWTYLPPLPKKLTSMCACVLNRKIYILGGTLDVTNTYFYEFNPLSNTYKQLAVFPVSRNNACLAVVDNLIYAVGGNSYKNDNYFVHNSCDVYNIITNSWEQKTSLPEALTRGSVVVSGNEIHYIGGLSKPNSVTDADGLNIHYIYDTKTDVWRNGESLPYRVWGNECVAVNNVIYSFGGYEKLPNALGKAILLKQ